MPVRISKIHQSEKDFLYLLHRYMLVNFETNAEAAEYYEVEPSELSSIKTGRRRPTKRMLEDLGYTYQVVSQRIFKPI